MKGLLGNYRAMYNSLLQQVPQQQAPNLLQLAAWDRFNNPYSAGRMLSPQGMGGGGGAGVRMGGRSPEISPGRGYHGSPTLRAGDAIDVNRSATAPRTDKGYFGKGFYTTPHEWIAKEYAKPPKGGQGGSVTAYDLPKGRYLDVVYNENYVKNLESAARRLGVKDKFMSPGWHENFAKAAQKHGYVGARGMNQDGSVAEMVIYDPSKLIAVTK